MSSQPEPIRYEIRPAPGGWTWRALHANGVTAAHGRAETRALAAACVIHAIASQVAPERLAA